MPSCAFVKALSRSIDWAYSDPKAIDNYADIAKVPPRARTADARRFLSERGFCSSPR